jgi:hypothetical protein
MTTRRLPAFAPERSFEPELAFSFEVSTRRQPAPVAGNGSRFRPSERGRRRRAIALQDVGLRGVGRQRVGRHLVQRLVVPHFGFGEQSPAFEGMKHRALAAQGLHRAVANEVFHFRLQPPCPHCFYSRFQDSDITILENFTEAFGSGFWNPGPRKSAP